MSFVTVNRGPDDEVGSAKRRNERRSRLRNDDA
jgi:hypothetical protein